jgi:hypothetical protein
MDPITIGLLAGAGLGLVKNQMEGQQAAKERKAEGTIAQWSPWTGMAAHRVKDPSMIGDVMSGGMTGAMLGQAAGGGAAGAAPAATASTEAGTSLAPAAEGAGNSTGVANMSVGSPDLATNYGAYGSQTYGQQVPPWMLMASR